MMMMMITMMWMNAREPEYLNFIPFSVFARILNIQCSQAAEQNTKQFGTQTQQVSRIPFEQSFPYVSLSFISDSV